MAIPVVEANIFVVEKFVFLYSEKEKSSFKVLCVTKKIYEAKWN